MCGTLNSPRGRRGAGGRGRGGDGFVAAHNVVEFHGAIRTVPMASLQHHLTHGDFSRWAAQVLGNTGLAQGLQKLERAVLAGASPNRTEICAHLAGHYLIQTDTQDTTKVNLRT